MVKFETVTVRASAPSVARAPATSWPPSGRISSSVSVPVVSVPVLSVHTTSTLLTDSTAFTCCTSAPRPARVAAPAV